MQGATKARLRSDMGDVRVVHLTRVQHVHERKQRAAEIRAHVLMFAACVQGRRARKIDDVVLVRLEQLAPFPHDIVLRCMRQYKNAEICWCQEEPKNQGAWDYVRCVLSRTYKI